MCQTVRNIIIATVGCVAIAAAGFARADTYFCEDREGAKTQTPYVWWGDANGKARLTTEKAFSGKRSVLIETGPAYWEIPLPKSLKWDRKDPAGIGNRPLYLSMRVYAVSGGAFACPGFRISIVPKRHPSSGGAPFTDSAQANVAGRTGQWLLLCVDVGQALRESEARGELNADHIVLESVSFFTYSGGKFYLDDLRLSTERPEGCSPPPPSPPKVDAAAHFRRDPKLENMVLQGVYGGIGSVLEDTQLHASTVRDIKRHYIELRVWNRLSRRLLAGARSAGGGTNARSGRTIRYAVPAMFIHRRQDTSRS